MSKRISKVAQCIRKTSATARIPRTLMPDSTQFDPTRLSPEMSSKFTEVIQTIRKLDQEDIKKHGTLYKHFIFTDIRESAYGAKAMASFMIAAGFDFRMESTGVRTIYKHKPAVENGCDGFAMLQSLPLWNKPLTASTKKEILRVFNSRPDNVNGELLRIMILDSKFKEGIDLFDVKYVHLLEPAIATSDLKQAVGRATRFCGQKGLPFAPRHGWKLNVYIYSSVLPNRHPFHPHLPPNSLGEKDPVDAHAFMLVNSGLDLALLNLTKELTILGIMTSVDYDLNYKINNFKTEEAVMGAVEDLNEMLVVELENNEASANANASALAKGGKKVVNIHRPEDIDDALLRKCSYGRKSKLFPFTKVTMHRVATEMGIKLPKSSKRGKFCELLKSNPRYLEKLFTAEQAIPDIPHMRLITPENRFVPPIDSETLSTSRTLNSYSPVSSSLSLSNPAYSSSLSESSLSLSDSPLSVSESSSLSESPLSESLPPWPRNNLDKFRHLPFDDFQKAAMDLYKEYKWDSPIVKSGCENTQFGKPGTAVTFTRTQDFVRHYLTTDSPFKGLLAWHSVGTGKTCIAVAAATSQFEKAGYSILWVTRNALMSDVYKNIFGSVCSIPLMEKLDQGAVLPSTLTQQKRMLSRSWMAPISYRTFQNALEGNNELGRILHKNNPRDPLHKTFLIMDEIHKLQDGDLSASESADFQVIQEYIYNSYSASGNQSVRPLFMTATPITDNPRELFEILNTLIPTEEQRLMPFPLFRETYSSSIGEISEEGKTYFKERAKGLISYLNLEFDPTTFSQPVFHSISVPVGGFDQNMPTAESLADEFIQQHPTMPDEPEDCEKIVTEHEAQISQVQNLELPPKDQTRRIKEIRSTMKQRKKECASLARTIKRDRSQFEQGAAKYYRKRRDEFANEYGSSQLAAVESCMTKKQTKSAIKKSFVDKNDFIQEITRRSKGHKGRA